MYNALNAFSRKTQAQQAQQAQQQREALQMSSNTQRLKCGEVYTWNCEIYTGEVELYAIECDLCEDRPLCRLDEFAEHMEIWHTSVCYGEAQIKEMGNESEEEFCEERNETNSASNIHIYYEPNDAKENPQNYVSPFEQILISVASPESSSTKPDLELVKENDVCMDYTMTEKGEEEQLEFKDTSVIEELPNTLTTYLETGSKSQTQEVELELEFYSGEEKEDNRTQLEESERNVFSQSDDSETECMSDNDNFSNTSQVIEQKEPYGEVDEAFESRMDPTKLELKQQINYGLGEPLSNTKLTPTDTSHLITLYNKYPRLWNQAHPEYHNLQLSRQSWRAITKQWNRYKRKPRMTCAAIRARLHLLNQRYLKERERLASRGESADKAKFAHYRQLQFLDTEQYFQHRRQLSEQQNRKLLELYQHYPLLWHSAYRHIRQPAERAATISSLSAELKQAGIHLSPYAVKQRLQALRKFYRLERIQHLQIRLEHKTFESKFKFYDEMQFLDRHIDPFVCAICGKLFENLLRYREHKTVNACPEDEQELHDPIGKNCSVINVETAVSKETNWKTLKKLTTVPKDLGIDLDSEEGSNDNSISPAYEEQSLDSKNVLEIADIFSTIINDFPCGKSNSSDSAIEMSIETLSNKSSTDNNDTPTENHEEFVEREQDKLIHSSVNDLVVKVQCEDFTYNLKVNLSEQSKMESNNLAVTARNEEKKDNLNGTNKQKYLRVKNTEKPPQSNDRMSVEETRHLIALYRQNPTLWNPSLPYHNSRKAKMVSWRAITTEFSKTHKRRYLWRTLQRKMTDLVKYYKREKQRFAEERSCSKWCFYKEFSFLTESSLTLQPMLDKALKQKRQQLQIIGFYKSCPSLWNTESPEHNKRGERQRHLSAIRRRLQQECKMYITMPQLQQRLNELRGQYRAEKMRRLECHKRGEGFTASGDFYETLQFLDEHISPFQCNHCALNFKLLSAYRQHLQNDHQKEDQNNNKPSKAPTVLPNPATTTHSSLDHICHICGIKFTLRSNLICHLKRHQGKATFACSTCPKTFFNSTSLRVHERYHTKEFPYMCESCGRSYVNASKLNQHMKRHRQQRDYACSSCEKRFYSAFDRDRHEQHHLNIRDKICAVCGKAFFAGSAYYAHMLLHTGEKRFACNLCDKRFAQYAGLYKHKKKYHSKK